MTTRQGKELRKVLRDLNADFHMLAVLLIVYDRQETMKRLLNDLFKSRYAEGIRSLT